MLDSQVGGLLALVFDVKVVHGILESSLTANVGFSMLSFCWVFVSLGTISLGFSTLNYSGSPDSVRVFQIEAANAARLGLAVFT